MESYQKKELSVHRHCDFLKTQDKWSNSEDARSIFVDYAKTLKLDIDKFKTDLDSGEIKKKVERDTADGLALGVDSTPTFYLNGEKINSPGSYDNFSTLVKAAILKQKAEVSSEAEYHAHFDLKVYINGKMVDLSLPKYQSTEDKELNEDIHLHDGNGDVVHIHKKGVMLSDLFTSIKITFPGNTGNSTLKVYVNGNQNNDLLNYVPQDSDRVLVTYGADSAKKIEDQINSVTDTACIYSEKCPERGKPPTEKCVGGLGSGCSD